MGYVKIILKALWDAAIAAWFFYAGPPLFANGGFSPEFDTYSFLAIGCAVLSAPLVIKVAKRHFKKQVNDKGENAWISKVFLIIIMALLAPFLCVGTFVMNLIGISKDAKAISLEKRRRKAQKNDSRSPINSRSPIKESREKTQISTEKQETEKQETEKQEIDGIEYTRKAVKQILDPQNTEIIQLWNGSEFIRLYQRGLLRYEGKLYAVLFIDESDERNVDEDEEDMLVVFQMTGGDSIDEPLMLFVDNDEFSLEIWNALCEAEEKQNG